MKNINKYGFLHVPRTAGGSVVNELMKTDWIILGHDIYSDHFINIGDYRKNHKEDITYLITTVRNPYDRLVSAYSFLMEGGDNENDFSDRDAYLSQFKSFEDFVLKGLNWFRRRKIMTQIHLRPQYYWMCDNSNSILVDHIFHFERLEELFDFISKHSEIKADTIPHVHASKKSHFEDYYSKKMKNIVFDCYKKDFRLFDYKK